VARSAGVVQKEILLNTFPPQFFLSWPCGSHSGATPRLCQAKQCALHVAEPAEQRAETTSSSCGRPPCCSRPIKDPDLSPASGDTLSVAFLSEVPLSRFARYSWSVLGLNLLVIVWGAYVRASNSGNGCGSHWPLCNGEVIPMAPTAKMLVEFSHRLTSGLALISVVVLLVWARRLFPPRHPSRIFASLAMMFMISEALLGAGLVLFEYVAENKSMGRALWMSAHLINTFLLVAMTTLTAWAADLGERRLRSRDWAPMQWLTGAALAGTLVLGVSGAVAALGATLFPVSSLAEGLKQDLSPTAHVLIRLRFLHPLIAVAVGTGLGVLGWAVRRSAEGTRTLGGVLLTLVGIQLAAGAINVLLHAPIWMQLLHLLLSDFIWVVLVVIAGKLLLEPGADAAAVAQRSTVLAGPIART